MVQALYRRYRPETFAEVIGQEHVTEPLQQALRRRRTSHAYLFSGPRGCGKTTSARILARCVNCEQGPTPDPCGVCDSCVALARGGPGHIDVIEIDAASHGGVDDARDLREKAFFSPAASRYKIYIVDEAHMVSSQGFNALLKIVEEPPPHVMFLFATTEPEKVIGTIRSRTHHYPFRLVPPKRLLDHLAKVCEDEGVGVEKGVLPLVVRAGAGSVRDCLSVLDQLMAGAGDAGIGYGTAVGLLGYTDAALLDDALEAFAAGDGAAAFRVVDRVVEAGHDPRRFAEDLLERLRDLIVVQAAPDAAADILAEVSGDQLDRMRFQAGHFGAAELSRAGDLVAATLTEMRGATAPRLHLELLCARILLPSAEDDPRSLAARLDRLERRLSVSGVPAAVAAPPAEVPAEVPAEAHAEVPAEPTAGAGAGESSATDLAAVRGLWSEVMGALSRLRRTTWTLVSQNASVVDLAPGRITLGFPHAGLRDAFTSGAHPDWLRQALIEVVGLDVAVEAILDPSAGSPAPPGASVSSLPPASPGPARPAAAVRPASTRPAGPGQPAAAQPQQARGGAPAAVVPAAGAVGPENGGASVDDPDAEDSDLSGRDLLVRELGATVIGEYDEGA